MVKDKLGREFRYGDTVARPVRYGASGAYIDLVKVTCVDGDKIYLNESKQAIRFPDRLIIINDLIKGV